MDISFVFKDELDELLRTVIKFDESTENVRGLSAAALNHIIINLEASQWKSLEKWGEDVLVKEIGKTISHEIMHILINMYNGRDRFTALGEERVCQILAGQITEPESYLE